LSVESIALGMVTSVMDKFETAVARNIDVSRSELAFIAFFFLGILALCSTNPISPIINKKIQNGEKPQQKEIEASHKKGI
jgi:hypothetical protein